MATLKSKRKQEAQIENLSKEVEETKKKRKSKKTESIPVEETTSQTPDIPVETPVEETSPSPYMNEAEQTALAEQHERDSEESKKVSIDKMKNAVEVVQNIFNLCDKDFSVNGFADKGSKCQLSMSNGDFDIVITVKDAEKFGIV